MNIMQSIRSLALVGALFFPGVAGIGSHVAASTGCTPQQVKDIKDVTKEVLSDAQLLCAFNSAFLDLPGLMEFCRIDSRFSPVIEALLEQKRAAFRAGWRPKAADAGAK